jgi:hypothetical protein
MTWPGSIEQDQVDGDGAQLLLDCGLFGTL